MPLQRLRRAAAHEEPPAKEGERGGDGLGIRTVVLGIEHLDIDDHVGCHTEPPIRDLTSSTASAMTAAAANDAPLYRPASAIDWAPRIDADQLEGGP